MDKQNHRIDTTTGLFKNIQAQVDTISAISEEHVASTEEILSSTEEQTQDILIMVDSIKNISELSKSQAEICNVKKI